MSILDIFKQKDIDTYDSDISYEQIDDLWKKINLADFDNLPEIFLNNHFDHLTHPKASGQKFHAGQNLILKLLDISIKDKKELLTGYILDYIDQKTPQNSQNTRTYFIMGIVFACHGRVDLLERYKQEMLAMPEDSKECILGCGVFKNQMRVVCWSLLYLNDCNTQSDIMIKELESKLDKAIVNDSDTTMIIDQDIHYYGAISVHFIGYFSKPYEKTLNNFYVSEEYVDLLRRVKSAIPFEEQWYDVMIEIIRGRINYDKFNLCISHTPKDWVSMRYANNLAYFTTQMEHFKNNNIYRHNFAKQLQENIFTSHYIDNKTFKEKLSMGDYSICNLIVKQCESIIDVDDLGDMDMTKQLELYTEYIEKRERNSNGQGVFGMDYLDSFLQKIILSQNIYSQQKEIPRSIGPRKI